MATAHAFGWYFRGSRRTNRKLGEVLHFIGAGLFLSNIALIGQTYNLSSRAPNAILCWLVGIVPLAWLLRAASIHALSLVGWWCGWEPKSMPTTGGSISPMENRNWLSSPRSVCFSRIGFIIDKNRFPKFGALNEHFGLILFHLTLWPMLVIGAFALLIVQLFLQRLACSPFLGCC